jgi:hypothetical protein
LEIRGQLPIGRPRLADGEAGASLNGKQTRKADEQDRECKSPPRRAATFVTGERGA